MKLEGEEGLPYHPGGKLMISHLEADEEISVIPRWKDPAACPATILAPAHLTYSPPQRGPAVGAAVTEIERAALEGSSRIALHPRRRPLRVSNSNSPHPQLSPRTLAGHPSQSPPGRQGKVQGAATIAGHKRAYSALNEVPHEYRPPVSRQQVKQLRAAQDLSEEPENTSPLPLEEAVCQPPVKKRMKYLGTRKDKDNGSPHAVAGRRSQPQGLVQPQHRHQQTSAQQSRHGFQVKYGYYFVNSLFSYYFIFIGLGKPSAFLFPITRNQDLQRIF